MNFISSIKGKITLLFLALFFILLTSVHGFLFYHLEKIVMASIDDHLHSEVQFIAALLEVEGKDFEVELSEANVGEFSVPLSGHYYQIFTEKRGIVVRSPSLFLPDISLPVPEGDSWPLLKTIIGPSGKKIRVISETLKIDFGFIIIQAAEPVREAEALLASYKKNMLTVITIVFFLSIPCIWYLTSASLKKLNSLSSKMENITEHTMNEHVEIKGLETELKPLSRAFNGLLVRLDDAFEQQREFLSNASHDLRTPLAIMKTTCQVTLNKERSCEEYKEALTDISSSVEHMSGIVHKILAMSRLDDSAYSLNYTEVDLYENLQNIVSVLSPLAKSERVSLSLKGDRIRASFDANRMKDVFLNVVENGIKYNGQEGAVLINVSRNKDEALIYVSDDGIGIEKNACSRIFDRFYRVDRSGTIEKGCGLGLSIASGIVTRHGGRIEVDSKFGHGSVFKIFLPLNPPTIT